MSHIGGLAMVETGRASGVMRWHVLSVEGPVQALENLERRFGDATYRPAMSAEERREFFSMPRDRRMATLRALRRRRAEELVERHQMPHAIGEIDIWAPRYAQRLVYKPHGAKRPIVSTRYGQIFPGYLLAACHGDPRVLKSVRGIDDVLMDGTVPATLSARWVERFLAWVAAHDGAVRLDENWREIEPGTHLGKRKPQFAKDQPVSVTDSAFGSFQGICAQDEGERIRVMHGAFSFDVAAENVRAA